jgi:peptide/nickel transport system substrate-binding protein
MREGRAKKGRKNMAGVRPAQVLGSALLSVAALLAPTGLSAAKDRIMTITATEPMTTDHPYGESSAPVYAMWCHTYGCLGRFDHTTGKPTGILAEKWEMIDPLTWRFTLRKGLKRHDGGPGPTSADVVHTLQRIRTDKESVHSSFVAMVDTIVPVDELTFDIKTKQPAVNLVSALFDRFIVTSADLFAKHGRDADKKFPFGWGPYRLEEYASDRRAVLRKNPEWREVDGFDPKESPDVVILQQMREPEQRVTALLNGEVQVARLIPPQLVRRLEGRKDVKVEKTGGIEVMFLAFNNKMAPWTDVRLRKAVAHSINRQLIIDRLLGGHALVQDGMIGPNQFCYTGKPDRVLEFNPARAKELLAEAGFKDGGPEIDFYTAVGRYPSDRQVAEVVAQMLRQTGFRVRLHTPEYANFWSDVRRGRSPFYYMGRGSVFDASDAAGQLYGTGGSPRVQYSNPKFDAVLKQQYAEADPQKRCQLWRQLNQMLIDDVPTHFMWTHSVITGLRANVELAVERSGEFWLPRSKMK